MPQRVSAIDDWFRPPTRNAKPERNRYQAVSTRSRTAPLESFIHITGAWLAQGECSTAAGDEKCVGLRRYAAWFHIGTDEGDDLLHRGPGPKCPGNAGVLQE